MKVIKINIDGKEIEATITAEDAKRITDWPQIGDEVWALETLQDDGSWEVYRVYKAHRAEGSKELEENYIAAHMLGEIVNLLDWGYSIHMAGQDE